MKNNSVNRDRIILEGLVSRYGKKDIIKAVNEMASESGDYFSDDEIRYILEPLKKFISEDEMEDVLNVFLNPEDEDDWDFYRNANMTEDELHNVFETMFPINYDEDYDENEDDDISEVYERLNSVKSLHRR